MRRSKRVICFDVDPIYLVGPDFGPYVSRDRLFGKSSSTQTKDLEHESFAVSANTAQRLAERTSGCARADWVHKRNLLADVAPEWKRYPVACDGVWVLARRPFQTFG